MRLNVFAKLAGGFAIVLLLLGVTGWIGYSGLTNVDDTYTHQMYENALVPIQDLGDAAVSFHRMRLNVLQVIVTDDKV